VLQAVGQEESYKDQVVVISVGETDLSNKQAFKFWRRTLERVNDEGAKAVIFQLDTPGGLAFDTLEIMVNELRDLKVPSYAFVDKKAISAGALISVATDEWGCSNCRWLRSGDRGDDASQARIIFQC